MKKIMKCLGILLGSSILLLSFLVSGCSSKKKDVGSNSLAPPTLNILAVSIIPETVTGSPAVGTVIANEAITQGIVVPEPPPPPPPAPPPAPINTNYKVGDTFDNTPAKPFHMVVNQLPGSETVPFKFKVTVNINSSTDNCVLYIYQAFGKDPYLIQPIPAACGQVTPVAQNGSLILTLKVAGSSN